jgi:mannose-6-phosphate isomerase-like protein (cupin superfamily)
MAHLSTQTIRNLGPDDTVEASKGMTSSTNVTHVEEKVTKVGTEIVRFKDLEPVWYLPRAKEPGFMRWLVTWVGGPHGFVNPSIGTSVISNHMAVGFMSLPRGQRQEGLHSHTVAEIYIILKGQLIGWDGRGDSHLGTTGDCIYIPAGKFFRLVARWTRT